MKRGESIERAISRAVALRRIASSVADEPERRRLARLQRDLRREIGFSVPKTRAATVLGVSVNALDRWVASGRLPTIRRPDSIREEIDADAVVELALQVELLREQGVERGVLAAAFERLAAEGKPKRRPRPNMTARQLRADYLSSTPLQRLAVGVELNRTGTILAALGHRLRAEKQ